MMHHEIDLTDPNLPPAKRQKITREYLITVENDFDITLQVGEQIATDYYSLIYWMSNFVSYHSNNTFELTEISDYHSALSTALTIANKLNITFIIYESDTAHVYHDIKTNPKIKMYESIKTANYLITSSGSNGIWYQGIPIKISPSNDIKGYMYQSFFKTKEPDQHELEVRFKIARLSIEMLAKFPQNKRLFNPNPYYKNDTTETEEQVKKVLHDNNYPGITQHLFGTLSTNLSTLIRKVNSKSTQKINETNIITNNFFKRIKDFSQYNQKTIELLKFFYFKRTENILNQINRSQNKQRTLNEITKFIVLVGEKLPNFTEQIIKFIAPIMENLYLKNIMSWSDITFFVTTLQKNINFDIDINSDRADNLTILIDELFCHDILSLEMLCRKHISFWSDERKESLNTLPRELQEQLQILHIQV